MDILDEVRQVISKTLNVPVDRLAPESRLEELGAESLDVIEIVSARPESQPVEDMRYLPVGSWRGNRRPRQRRRCEEGGGACQNGAAEHRAAPYARVGLFFYSNMRPRIPAIT